MQTSVSIRDLSLSFGNTRILDKLNLDIEQGEFIVLLGPSGCGKSTLLNCIAGLLDIDDGEIHISGRNVTWAEPKDRGIGMVFQSYALYPQMTVEKNLSFGLRVAGFGKAEIQERVQRASEILQIQPLLKRKPVELSGGQRQRVAIGRALVRDVDVFLFDEPLSNLDAKLRSDLRVEIKRLHRKLKNTMVYVTHDQIEALTLANRIAIMKEGEIQQLANPHTIYHKPVNLYVAGFIGSPSMNFLQGAIQHESGANDPLFVTDSGLRIPLAGYPFAEAPDAGLPAVLGVRPEHINIADDNRPLPFQQQVEIDIVEPMGSETLVWTQIAGQTITFSCDSDVLVEPGQTVTIGFDPVRASVFDRESTLRL
ncbi:ABC transporter ATP-binding protein [Natronospirillum operosum]|uniref:ABC transporter ATP-binding protein n=1 Tax=Natronospirillum operosum TaxID=2759953 RepID=A0A4Z0WDB6_9GAMM|nr:ABC transporter ATP-binding protein [Natronospirillum operosum]TGG93192.1 ABC transporter ATP-binding protein [Natronospirillum operosum]